MTLTPCPDCGATRLHRPADACPVAHALDPNPLALLTDAELDAMTRRAYAGAAAAWIAHDRYTAPRGTPAEDCRAVRAILYDDATSLDDWYTTLRAEQRRRQDTDR